MTYNNLNIILVYNRLQLFLVLETEICTFYLFLGNQNDNIAKQTIPQTGQGK